VAEALAARKHSCRCHRDRTCVRDPVCSGRCLLSLCQALAPALCPCVFFLKTAGKFFARTWSTPCVYTLLLGLRLRLRVYVRLGVLFCWEPYCVSGLPGPTASSCNGNRHSVLCTPVYTRQVRIVCRCNTLPCMLVAFALHACCFCTACLLLLHCMLVAFFMLFLSLSFSLSFSLSLSFFFSHLSSFSFSFHVSSQAQSSWPNDLSFRCMK